MTAYHGGGGGGGGVECVGGGGGGGRRLLTPVGIGVLVFLAAVAARLRNVATNLQATDAVVAPPFARVAGCTWGGAGGWRRGDAAAAAAAAAAATAPHSDGASGSVSVAPCGAVGVASAAAADDAWEALMQWLPPPAGRALLAIPAGARGADAVDVTLCAFLGAAAYDVVLFAYDAHDWSAHPWYADRRVRVVRDTGQKYVLAARHLTPAAVANYSHVFLWDADVVPAVGRFSAYNLLRLLQAMPHLHVASPYVDAGCHVLCHHVHTPPRWHALAEAVEMMVPIYRTATWLCLAAYVTPDAPDAWGLDAQPTACGCGADIGAHHQALLLHFRVDHVDTKSLGRTFDMERAMAGWRRAEADVAAHLGAAAYATCNARYTAARAAARAGNDNTTLCLLPPPPPPPRV